MRHAEHSQPEPSWRYAVYECADSRCRLRYPAPRDEPRAGRCPSCKGATASEAPFVVCDDAPRARTPPAPFHVLVDNVRSAFNVGSILRTAEGVGAAHVYLCGISPPADSAKVAKTALGAERRVPSSSHPNAVELAEALLDRGHLLWALEAATGSSPLFGAPPPDEKTVLVVGNELAGVDRALLARCSRVLDIAMAGPKSSFNVAVAFGIAAAVLHHRGQGRPAVTSPTLAS